MFKCSSSDLGDCGLIVLKPKMVISWACTLQMIEVMVSVLSGSFFNMFFRRGLNKLNRMFILTARPIALPRTRTMRVATVALITPLARMVTRITTAQSIHQGCTMTTFLQQVLKPTTDHPDPRRSNPITVPVLSLHLIYLIIVFSRRPFCHFGYY